MPEKSMIPVSNNVPLPSLTTEDECQEFLKQISPISRLTAIQKSYLMCIIHDTMSEKPRTLKEMAAEMGCTQRQLVYINANPNFNLALGLVMVGISRGRTHIYVAGMHKLADKGDFRALKFMLEYGGTYVKKAEVMTKNLNVMMQQEDTTNETFMDAVDNFLTRMGTRGWTAERLVTRFQQLASEGAW